MTQTEIDVIRLALDTEVEHTNYAKHNLDAKIILNKKEVHLNNWDQKNKERK